MDLPPRNTEDSQGVELKHVNIVTPNAECRENLAFTIESEDRGPPPYSNGHKYTPSHNTKPRADWVSSSANGHITTINIPPISTQDAEGGGLSPPDAGGGRRRHRSEGALNTLTITNNAASPKSNNLLDPNRKNSMYESRSTISGVKFDDSFIEDNKSFDYGSDSDGDENGLTLMYSRHEKLPLKDFSLEIRAAMDIQRFLNNTVLLLDLNKISMDEIIDEILHKMLDGTESEVSFDQARSALFTHDYVHMLSRTLQCTSISEGGGFDYDQNWICAMASVPSILTRHVGIARLRTAANLGTSSQEVYFIIVVLTPIKEKGTKNELETGRTFSTIFSDLDFRLNLLAATTEDEFKSILEQHTKELADRQMSLTNKVTLYDTDSSKGGCKCGIFKGIRDDLRRRFPHYISDYKDGIFGPKTIQKTLSTTLFLYFACLMPSIAFGVLNAENTDNVLTVEKVLYSQTFGGLVFAVFGGTPLIVLLTTAPLALYTKIIHSICEEFDLDFRAMFACVGIWNSFFLFLYAAFDLSVLMQWSTRSSEEIFALFIAIAFCVDAFKNTAKNFGDHYNIPNCNSAGASASGLAAVSNATGNMSANISDTIVGATRDCEHDISLLYLLLLLGTLWLGVMLYNFTKTPYLNAGKRELLADYALPVSVVIMSLIGALAFKDVDLGKSFDGVGHGFSIFSLVPFHKLSWGAVLGGMGLGFCLSLLFFMDQNISAALVNSPQNKMKKGTSYHWDLVVVAIINLLHSLVAFPWVHAALPHSPLHVRALADVEERVDQGHIYQIIVKVRETRLTAILSHILIGLSLLFMDALSFIPTPVLYGLFLYVGVTSLDGNQMFERIMLLFTEQSAYPPNHYIRRVPQRKMHSFTLLQLLQLVVLCGFGFAPYPYLKMFFPVLIFLLIPLRHKVIPHVIEHKYLKAMDSH
ncbi:sodium bicarbonate transporter-like protein 11 isoform X2 [Mizuhopecten yessoensis]|uniref:Sodium bicarbonate transporter-like protein 11 n=2 Tax=Mizuhopecten yessoensis TaxID=6573 RepID=A0A210Q8T2_MIZYE|nr:sodium bicarbonate transporter-like protein 11 isoform X2 [Mizuhopecten yessoensis]XP_021364355.1 sodium bicarbonate transporter-like protein 11 isoform X2 [Mizuhopecten yessoensis]XP_021364357.1 sodium bicarbonate transporter-like protein 11 isoform X2 [Mizuhopecten yessoensis]XP_021364358.1 sodium bicarbonate transporter-like protein 11 isoform X2 [Mizuhopecten yessoensis]XP_021364359.1 sodium bicarbonate transporter-like protein 11 isoform X2 [Mizuhopecten yessoensis]XP_021364360.1 sodiu